MLGLDLTGLYHGQTVNLANRTFHRLGRVFISEKTVIAEK